MKRKYTRKQILESIRYWKKQLNESAARCCGDEAVMCYITHNTAYDPYSMLYIAPDVRSLALTFKDQCDSGSPITLVYDGMTVTTDESSANEWINVFKAMYADGQYSTKGITASITELDTNYEYEAEFNFKQSDRADDSSIYWCPEM